MLDEQCLLFLWSIVFAFVKVEIMVSMIVIAPKLTPTLNATTQPHKTQYMCKSTVKGIITQMNKHNSINILQTILSLLR